MMSAYPVVAMGIFGVLLLWLPWFQQNNKNGKSTRSRGLGRVAPADPVLQATNIHPKDVELFSEFASVNFLSSL